MILQEDTFQKYGYYLPSKTRSESPVICSCDFCGKKYEKGFYSYNRTSSGGASCGDKSCVNAKREKSSTLKFGVKNAFQSEDIKEKIKKTNIQKYGVDNSSKNPDIVNKIRGIHTEKYGGYGI